MALKELIQNIDGWLTDEEAKLLYKLAKNCKGKGVIVEIGSWKGKSTICMAKGSKAGNNVKIYAIDPHVGSSEHKKKYGKVWTFDEFKKNINNAKVGDIVLPIVKTSEEAAKKFNEPIEFIFIDGAHEYELVKLDFELWFPKVINGGIIAFHDTTGWPGPRRLVKEKVYKSKRFKDVKFVDSITYGVKVNKNTSTDRIKHRYVLFVKDVCELVYYNIKLPKPILKIGKKILSLVQ